MIAAQEKKDRISSAVISVGIHLLLLLLLLWLGISFNPLPAGGEGSQGILIDFGNSEQGMGMEESLPEVSSPSSSAMIQESDPVTQDVEPAPVVSTEKKQNKEVPKNNQQTQITKQDPKPIATYTGAQSSGTSGDGQNQVPGNIGKPFGDPNGSGVDGNPGNGFIPGTGNATLEGMGGRYLAYLPPIDDKSQKVGTVVVNIKVDREGKVIYAKAAQKGSTTTDTYLWKLAEEAALKSKVNKAPNAPIEQWGTITYRFKVK